MAQGGDVTEFSELVDKVARRLHRELDLHCELDDLRGWGHTGALEAKARFDPTRGAKFSTFAYYRVRGAMIDGIRSQGFLPRRAYAKLKAYEASDATASALAEQPAPGDAATRANQVEDVLGKITAAFVIAAVGQDEADRPADDPVEHVARGQLSEAVRGGLGTLPEKERVLLQAVYFENTTIEEAGARLGLSKSWASRLHARALERMRDALAEHT